MTAPAQECPRCSSRIAPGTAYCVRCGASIPNRTAHVRTVDPPGNALAHPDARMNGEGGQRGTMAQLNLENGSAGKRLGAKLVDGIPPALITGLAAVVGMPLIGYEQVSASSAVVDLSMFFVVTGAGSLLALGYWIFLWGWEARTGKTLGNLMFGLRTTNEEGLAPGWLAVFLRNLIIGLSGIVPVIGFVIVMISNLFDSNGKRQGWYDKAARTFVFDIRRGRNPLVTGGINGPSSFAPQPQPPAVQPIPSPVISRRAPGASQPEPQPAVSQPGPAVSQPGPAVSQPQQSTFQPEPVVFQSEKVPTGRTAPLHDFDFAHPDEEGGETVVSRRSAAVPPNSDPFTRNAVRIRLDDGRDVVLQSAALVGRNPAAKDNEPAQLIPVKDEGRSVSKTHLHLRVEAGRLWVTDRHSTNGSAVSGADGERTPLPGGQPYWAAPGSTVHFGDHSFKVEQA
ncbi:RDD family protein [uncultured Arthrobacter sp.]|uniref:RDD family protein n=1 Tax=uncultured Arthrobacter sp. TaxID=114050 RepID=UPI002616AC47|nr:RDD family protein [uncultured Arthrobacter sp.]